MCVCVCMLIYDIYFSHTIHFQVSCHIMHLQVFMPQKGVCVCVCVCVNYSVLFLKLATVKL